MQRKLGDSEISNGHSCSMISTSLTLSMPWGQHILSDTVEVKQGVRDAEPRREARWRRLLCWKQDWRVCAASSCHALGHFGLSPHNSGGPPQKGMKFWSGSLCLCLNYTIMRTFCFSQGPELLDLERFPRFCIPKLIRETRASMSNLPIYSYCGEDIKSTRGEFEGSSEI